MKNQIRKNLNYDIYQRFGLSLDIQLVQNGFYHFIKNEAQDKFKPLIHTSLYKDSSELKNASTELVRKFCRQNFLDYKKLIEYSSYAPLDPLIEKFFDSTKVKSNFNQYVTYLQILINIIYEQKIISYEFNLFIEEIKQYFIDFPILGLQVKTFKILPPKIIPSVSKKLDQEISDTLDLIENPEFIHVLQSYEQGLKEFLKATTNAEYKDVIEDMYTACDELIKVKLKNKSKGFRQISDKDEAKILGLNGHQKEAYKNLRRWMDEIKHGTLKDFNKNDVEMIISLISALIRFIINT